ncbi:MAG: multifunctional CCA addition/repair protein [Gammaproteobacteria bacterium]|jgi:tRNA nucleotidyltransferase (CCA-adding enzyme)|nr:multifunctional CCA addition/repair protein [Gammaproteobacteria bacterium]
MKVYLVGGAVRDELLGLEVGERDWVVVGASQVDMLALNYTPVGKFFPVFLHPQTKEEYALARIERKVSGGYHGFTFDTSTNVTLEQDLARRDLTINAMAKTPEGKIIDPYGGQEDIKNKWLRHVSPAFEEDPVRVLRVARFAARFVGMGFRIAPETLALMQSMGKKGELDFLVPERVCKELLKALSESTPVAFIQALRQSNNLKILFPEIDALYGVPQKLEHHPEKDTGIHIELVLNQAARLTKDPSVRFASLLHDVGKALTPKENLPSHSGHEEKGEALVLKLCQRLKVPQDFQTLARLVTKYHGMIHATPTLSAIDILQLFEHCDAFRRPERFDQIILACEADFRGRPGYEYQEYRSGNLLRLAFARAQDVDIANIIANVKEKGGEAIKLAIHQAREATIKSFLKN